MIKKIFIIACALIMPVIAVGALTIQSFQSHATNRDVLYHERSLSDIKMWNIGYSTSEFQGILNKIQQLGVKKEVLSITRFSSDNDLRSQVLSKASIIVFDGTWLQEQTKNTEVISFVNQTAKNVGGFIAIGGNTSTLCDLAEKAGIYTMGRNRDGTIRNPLYYNPRMAGIRLVQTTTSNGTQYYYPSVFGDAEADTVAALDHLASWIER